MTISKSVGTRLLGPDPTARKLAQTLGRRLRFHRARLGVSQQELAQRASLARSYLSALERGKAGLPRLLTLVRLARSLEVEVAELVRHPGDDHQSLNVR
jgi:transcriptional regulator with XRE-family HTH domain